MELQLPVGFPDVDGLGVCDAVLQGLVVQQVEKVFDSQRYGATGAEDGTEQIVHKLLQGALRQQSTGQQRESTETQVRWFHAWETPLTLHTKFTFRAFKAQAAGQQTSKRTNKQMNKQNLHLKPPSFPREGRKTEQSYSKWDITGGRVHSGKYGIH